MSSNNEDGRVVKAISLNDKDMRIDTKRQTFVMQDIQNRRFMFNPHTGTLILGRQHPGKEMSSSHAEEHGRMGTGEPYDDFIRGWIGTGRSYKDGVIHFAPPIPASNPDIFESGYTTLEMFIQNGANQNTVIRAFPGEWEQPLSNIVPVVQINKRRKEVETSMNTGQDGEKHSLLDELEDNKNKLALKTFDVTITETLQKVVTVEAHDLCEAEEMVEAAWNNSEYILDADHFKGASFEAKEAEPERAHTAKRAADAR